MLMKLLLIQLLWQEILQLKIELQENLQPKIHWHNDPENLQIQQPNMQLQIDRQEILQHNLQPKMQPKIQLQKTR